MRQTAGCARQYGAKPDERLETKPGQALDLFFRPILMEQADGNLHLLLRRHLITRCDQLIVEIAS